MRDRLCAGDVVVDATAGNGHDTLFLSQLVGGDGHVHAFDIQADAITATHQRLVEAGVSEACWTLHLESHEGLASSIPNEHLPRLRAIMFNLGYLPGSDKTVITQPAGTLEALAGAIQLLRPGGLMTVVAYPGHEGGDEEARLIAGWARSIPHSELDVQLLRPVNRSAAPPECWVFLKRS
jgi:predicted methyltransferase